MLHLDVLHRFLWVFREGQRAGRKHTAVRVWLFSPFTTAGAGAADEF